jgi:oligopeptide transport system substrate-binding protein
MHRLLILALLLVALLAASMAWSGGAGAKRADLIYIDRGDIITLDINQMSYLQDFRISYATREGLYCYRAGDLAPIPAGASSVDVTADKKTWTFHLRPEAVWTNGDPVRSKDYLFAWRRMLQEPGEYTYLFYYVKNAREFEAAFQTDHPMPFEEVGVKALDDFTLQVTLHDPCTFFLDLVSFCPYYPMNERSMEGFKVVDPKTKKVSYRTEYTKPPAVVTNGPYYLADWQFKRRLLLLKSPTYWDREHVTLNSIESQVNDDNLSKLLTYESHGCDWMADIPNELAADMMKRHRKDLSVTPGFGTVYLNVNVTPNVQGFSFKNPLSDRRVRQAIDMAIDKEMICASITRMGEKPATTYIPPGIFAGYHTTLGLPYDVNKAKQLLADAGYPNGQGFPTIPVTFNNTLTMTRDIIQNLKNQLKQNLNIELELQGYESKVANQKFKQKQYLIGPSDWIGDYGDPSTFTDKYLSTSANNDSAWAVPEFDGLCAKAAAEPDPEKRLLVLEEAEKLINTDLPVIPIYYLVNMDLCRPYAHVPFNPRMTVNFKSLVVDKH